MADAAWQGVSVLVTGAAGFIGANLVRVLLDRGAVVHVLQHGPGVGRRLAEVVPKLTCHAGDLIDSARVAGVLADVRPRAVFHLAAYGTAPDQTDAQWMFRTNVEGTLNLLRALDGLAPVTFVNTGTSAEYGAGQRPRRESDPPRPGTLYGVAKAAATLLCTATARSSPHQIVTLRPFHVYGPFDDFRRFIPVAMRACLYGEPLPLVAGVFRRDFVYVTDVVEAYLLAAESRSGMNGEVFNIGSGSQHTMAEAVRVLSQVARRPIKIVRGFPPRQWDRRDWGADVGKARRRLGWRARYSLEEGLRRTLAWHREFAGAEGSA